MGAAGVKPGPYGITPILPLPDKYQRRFWRYVDRRGPDDCWPWTKGRTVKGYGRLRGPTTTIHAHRIAYALHTGHDPLGWLIKHSCDNKPCCNPAHLSIGTNAENIREAADRGLLKTTRNNGEANGRAKLTAEKAMEIIRRLIAGQSYQAIAADLSVAPDFPRNIMRGKAWKALAAEMGWRAAA